MAWELLVPELDEYHHSSNLAALRYLVDSHDPAFWDSSIYSMRLDAIRALCPPVNREHPPPFMQTTAWSHQKMNTQSSSWTELRRNSILYAKQSYTPEWVWYCRGACLEPFPEFYRRLQALADVSHLRFDNIAFSHAVLGFEIVSYLGRFSSIIETLETITRKELDGTPLTEEEASFMKEMPFMRVVWGLCYLV